MALRDDLLPKRPPYPWEGWFLIGIGDADCPIRWHKTHVYRGGQRPFRYPVSAVEGLRTPEVVTFVATADRVYEAHDPLERGALRADEREFDGGDGAAVGGLSLPLPLLGSRGVRAGGRIPGHELCAFRDFSVDVLDTDGGVPSRWRGRMISQRGGELSYEAVAATPVVVAARGVHFVGTEFSARYDGRTFEGRGFTECGGPV